MPLNAYVLSCWCVRRHKEDESRRDEDAVGLQARQSRSGEPEPRNTSQAELLTPIQRSKNLTQTDTLTGSTTHTLTHTRTHAGRFRGQARDVFRPSLVPKEASILSLSSLCLTFDRSWQRKDRFLLCQHSKDFLKSSLGGTVSPRNNKTPVILQLVFPPTRRLWFHSHTQMSAERR